MPARKVLISLILSLVLFISYSFAGIEEIEQKIKEKDYQSALKEAETIISSDAAPYEKARAQYRIAKICHYYLNQPQKALEECQKTIEQYPEAKDIVSLCQYLTGSCYYQTKEYDKAIEEFQKVVDSEPVKSLEQEYGTVRAISQRLIGDIYYRTGDYEKSIAAYRKVPNYTVDRYILSNATYSIGIVYRNRLLDNKNAQKYFLEVLNQYPDQTTYVQKAFALLDKTALDYTTRTLLYQKLYITTPKKKGNIDFLSELINESGFTSPTELLQWEPRSEKKQTKKR